MKFKPVALACLASVAILFAYVIYFRSLNTIDCIGFLRRNPFIPNAWKVNSFPDRDSLLLSAKLGYPESQYKLAWAYQHPWECQYRDFKSDHVDEESYFWASLAANGDHRFSEYRDELAKKLSTEQINVEKKRIAEWKAMPEPTDIVSACCDERMESTRLAKLEKQALGGDRVAADTLITYSVMNLKSEKEMVKWLEVAVKDGDDKRSTSPPGYARYVLARIYIGKRINTEMRDEYSVTPESCARGRRILQELKSENVISAKSASEFLTEVPPDCGLNRKGN